MIAVRAWVFPGQGSQHPGMGEGLLDRFPAECATAERIIGVPPAQLCRDVRGEYLGRTYMESKRRPAYVVRKVFDGRGPG